MKKHKSYFHALILISLILIRFGAFCQIAGVGQVPVAPAAGDNICNATLLRSTQSCSLYSVDSSTTSPQATPGCWATAAKSDVWFYFTATSQAMSISTDVKLFTLLNTQGSGYGLNKTDLALYSSSDNTCNGTLTQLACSNGGTAGQTGINGVNFLGQNPGDAVINVTGLTPYQNYFIRLDGEGATAGNFCISVFDTWIPGSSPCQAQIVYPNNSACAATNGNMVINATSSSTAVVNGVQPNSYVPLGQSYCGGNSPAQYGTWTVFTDSSNTVKLTNESGGTRVYTLFSGATCQNLTCLTSYTLAATDTVDFTGLTLGTTYYILTTLTPNNLTTPFSTNLCLQNTKACSHPPTPKNVGGVAGAGGSVNTDNCANSYGITLGQAYQGNTYCVNADGSGSCDAGNNIWFSWTVPAGYPANGEAYFQMWNKNCTGGPANPAINLIVAISNPCGGAGTCFNFNTPSAYSLPNAAYSTNVGWNPNLYSTEYWGIFTADSGAVCSFNFAINPTPSLPVVLANNPTICMGQSATITAINATGYSWSTGETSAKIIVTPSVTTNYTVTATSGATGYYISTVQVNPLPTATITGNTTVCKGVTSPNIIFTGSSATKLPYVFTYNINGGASKTITTTGTNNSVSITAPTNTVGTYVYNLISVKESSSVGCSNAQSGTATVVVNTLPTATLTGTVTKCLNDPNPTIKFTGSGSTAPYSFTYKINIGTNQTLISTSGNTDSVSAPTNIAGTYTYSLVNVIDSLGCSQAQTGSAVVTISTLHAASIVGTTTVCQNSTSPLIMLTGTAGTPAYSFTYKINAAATSIVSSNGASSTATLTAPTTTVGSYVYTISKVTDAVGLTCNSIGTATITVISLPTASITGTVTKCLNDPNLPPIVFTGATTSPPYTFTYRVSDGTTITTGSVTSVSGISSATVYAPTSAGGTYTYSLISVQDANSCINNQSGSAIVTINPMGATLVSSTTVCQNSTSPIITFTGTSGTVPYSFVYNIGGVGTQTLITAGGLSTATVSAPTGTVGISVYNLTSVKDNSGVTCNSAASASVTTNALPTGGIIGTTTLCLNAINPVITFTGAGTANPYTFVYGLNDGTSVTTSTVTSTNGSNTLTISAPTNVAGTFTYSLISIKDGTSATCAQNQTGSAVITINPLQATITGETTVCQNSAPPPTVTFTGSGGTPPYTFTYSIGGTTQPVISSIGANSTATVSAPTGSTGNFVYALISIQDASSLSCLSTPSITITVSSLPTATIAGDASRCLNGANPLITFNGAGSASPYTFTYNINGGVNQTVTTTSGNSVMVAAPTGTVGAFTYSLVSVQDGTTQSCAQTQTGSTTVTITPLPTATVSTTTPEICQTSNGTITFTGAVGTPPFTYNYNLNGGSTQTISSIGTNTSVSLTMSNVPGKYSYNLLNISDVLGCTQGQTNTAAILVDSLPTATVGGNAVICMNGLVTVSGANASNGGVNWTGNGAGSLTNITTLSPTYTPVLGDVGKAIILTMTVTGTNSCNPATAAATFTVNVDSLPLAIAGGNATICVNTSKTISGTYSKYGSVLWTDNGIGNLTNATTLTPTYNAVAGDASKTVTLRMTITSTNACAPQSATAVYIINVDSLPIAASGGSHIICQNASYTLQNGEASQKNGTPSWAVTNGAGSITSGVTTLTPAYTAVALDAGKAVVLTMTVSSSNTCVGKTATANYTIDVDFLPSATVGGNQTICQNSNAPVTFTANQGTAPYTFVYTQTVNGVQTSGSITSNSGNTAAIQAPTDSKGIVVYSLVSVKDANCSQPLNSIQTLTVLPLPSATISGGGSVCKDSIGPVINFVGIGTSPLYFTFFVNGKDSIVAESNSNGSYKYTTSTSKVGTFVYSLISIKDANCTNTLTGQAQTLMVSENPEALFTLDPEETSILAPTITINNLSIGAKSYMWSFGDSSISASNKPQSHTYKDTGTYKIKLMITNGNCKDSTYQTVRILLPLLVYIPNSFTPNGDGRNDIFKAEGDGFTNFEMMIFDRWGQLIFTSDDIDKGWNGKANMGSDISMVDAYIYVINLRSSYNKHDYTYKGVFNLLK